MIAALILPLFAQAAEPLNTEWSCDDPIMQQEMNWCAARDFEVADERLNAQWPITAAAMKAISKACSNPSAAGCVTATRIAGLRGIMHAVAAWNHC